MDIERNPETLSDKLTAGELIRANREAEAKESERLKEQNVRYEEALSVLRDQADRNMEAIAGFHEKLDTVSDKTHDTGVRIYRNVQAVIVEEQKKQTEALTERLNTLSERTEKVGEMRDQVHDLAEQMEDLLEQVNDLYEQTEGLSGQIKTVSESTGRVNAQTEGMSGQLRAISDRTEKVGELSQRMQVVTERTGRMEELSAGIRALSERLDDIERKVDEASKKDGSVISILMLVAQIITLALVVLQYMGITL